MASTFSGLKIQLMATGENASSWGTITNDNLGTAIEQAIAKSGTVSFSGVDVTLTYTNTPASQTFRNMRLRLTGTGPASLVVPATEKLYIIQNDVLDTITIKNPTGANVAVPTGKTTIVYSTGAGVIDVVNYLSTLSLGTPLAITSGGTGANSAALARDNLDVPTRTGTNATGTWSITATNANNAAYLGGVAAANYALLGDNISVFVNNQNYVRGTGANGTNGQVLTSNGTNVASWTTLPAAPINNQFPIGGVLAWYGPTGTWPANYSECDGTAAVLQLTTGNVTITKPNLRDRTVVGAGNLYTGPTGSGPTYSTGGSKDSVVVSHTHGITDLGHIHNIVTHNGGTNQYGWVPYGGGGAQQSGSIGGGGGTWWKDTIDVQNATTGISVNTAGVTGVNQNMPPYTALFWLIRLY